MTPIFYHYLHPMWIKHPHRDSVIETLVKFYMVVLIVINKFSKTEYGTDSIYFTLL